MRRHIQRFSIFNLIGIMMLAMLAMPVSAETDGDYSNKWESSQNSRESTSTQKKAGPPPRKGGPIMRAIDTDRDGELSATEIENASRALRSLDTDGDGMLSNSELRPEPPPRYERRQQQQECYANAEE